MTLNNAKTMVRSAIGEEDPGFWTATDITNYINAGLHAMCEMKGLEDVQRIVVSDDLRMGLPANTKFVESVYLYPLDATLTLSEAAPTSPTDGDYYVKPSTMEFYSYSSTTGTWTAAEIPTRDDLKETGDLKEIKDNFLVFDKELSGLLEILMYRYPDTLVSDSDIMELPEVYCYGVLAYAKAQAFNKDDNFPQYDRQMAEFARVRLAWEGERMNKGSHFSNRWI